MQKFERVPANQQVIDMLERFLVRAKDGKVNFIGLVACENQNFCADFIGDTRSYYVANFGFDYLKNKLIAGTKLSQEPEISNEGAPANSFCYNLTTEPVCFDFVVWLATAEMIRRREGASAPLRIAFIRGDDEGWLPPDALERRNGFLKNVMIPALQLFGAINDPEAAQGRRLRTYALKELTEADRAGEHVPGIVVPEHTALAVKRQLKGSHPVTITLRNSGIWEHRNSNLDAWIKSAVWLRDTYGEKVIFVRDTSEAEKPVDGFEIFPAASKNLLIRAALYEQAKCNLFVSNGPSILGILGSRPWLMFVTVRDDEPCPANTPAWWRTYQGIGPGEQYPWCNDKQRMVWADDTFENICAAWDTHIIGSY